MVVLYNSNWKPQVNLQAMDRNHRIGQTKPVLVLQLVTEGFVEEKTIERTNHKIFLDAAVIQQGHLLELHHHTDKKKLIHMLPFGANKKLSSKKCTYMDKDVDAPIAEGEEHRNQMQADLQTNT